MKRLTVLWLASVLALVAGCSEIRTEYGQSRGVEGRTSLNGFGALRRAFEQAGFRSRDVTRLSNRVRRTDVIVWTPQVLRAIDGDVTTWFEGWLRQGDRTLVYILPDSGSEADYWMEVARLAPPGQRLEYRRRAARSINQRIAWRLNRPPVQSNGWFEVEPLQTRQKTGQLRGPWREQLEAAEAARQAASPVSPAIEYSLSPFDVEAAKQQAANAAPQAVVVGPTGPGTSGSGAMPWSVPSSTRPSSTPVKFRPLLFEDRSSPIVAEITSNRWRNSKILVVAGGSWLTNYAFSQPAGRQLADQIIAASQPPRETESERLAGFLTSDWRPVAVSEREPDAPRTSGMEMLSEWPISMITMHGVILGVVICLILLPTFGRPRKVRRTHANDFAHHLDAVAALMKRAGGERYARGRISEYMKRIHGETTGAWVLPDQTPPATSAPLASTKGKRLPSKEKSATSIGGAAASATARGESDSLQRQGLSQTRDSQTRDSQAADSQAAGSQTTDPSSPSSPDRHSPSSSRGSQQQDKADP